MGEIEPTGGPRSRRGNILWVSRTERVQEGYTPKKAILEGHVGGGPDAEKPAENRGG